MKNKIKYFFIPYSLFSSSSPSVLDHLGINTNFCIESPTRVATVAAGSLPPSINVGLKHLHQTVASRGPHLIFSWPPLSSKFIHPYPVIHNFLANVLSSFFTFSLHEITIPFKCDFHSFQLVRDNLLISKFRLVQLVKFFMAE